MSLIDRLIEPTKDYISFRDFIFHLSSINNEPLYEVVTYLLHHNLNSIGFYNIDTDYKIIRFDSYEFESVTEFLTEIQKTLVFTADEWIFSDIESLNELRDSDRRELTNTVSKAIQSFFKKSELLSFEPLNGLLHFDTTDSNQPKTYTIKHQELGEYQKLLVSYELLTPHHITCLITDRSPTCNYSDNTYDTMWDMITTSLDAKKLIPINEKYQIPIEQVKTWLVGKGFIYQGFNDDLTIDQSVQNEELQKRIAELEQEAADAKSTGSFMMGTPTVTQTEPPNNDQLIKELAAAKAQIADLESDLKQAQADNDQLRLQGKQANDSLLTAIHDKSNEHHAPDLSYAIRLWSDLYIDGLIGTDSHTNKANLWIGKNTSYGDNAKSSTERIKDISSPSKKWSSQRSKE